MRIKCYSVILFQVTHFSPTLASEENRVYPLWSMSLFYEGHCRSAALIISPKSSYPVWLNVLSRCLRNT